MLFAFHTYGCQMNVRDSEAGVAALSAAGHQHTDDQSVAELIVVNTCSVRGKAEDKALGKLGLLCAAKKQRPELIVGVMGCMAQRLGEEVFRKVPLLDFSIGTRCSRLLPEIVARVISGERGICSVSALEEHPEVLHDHSNIGFSAFVTVLLGCERRCSYCIVPDVRGVEYSRPVKEVLQEVSTLAEAGVREVTLLGQSVLNYGRNNSVFDGIAPLSNLGLTEPFALLLEQVAGIDGIERIRFTSSHPSGCTAELLRAMQALPEVCAHIHLPCQSGSDRILTAMRRGYTRQYYLDTVDRLRQALPEIAITTDVIVGFPGESRAEFEETRSLLEEAEIDNTFIFKYSSRPGTPAAALIDDVSPEEKMRRNQVLLEDQDIRGLRINERLKGSVQQVLVEGASLRNVKRWSGRTDGHKIVLFEPEGNITPGEIRKVKITRTAPQTLYGTLVCGRN